MQFPQIRTIKPDEWALLREVRIRALIDSPDAFGSTLERENVFVDQDWKNRIERHDCITILAFSDFNSPIGLISGAPYGQHVGLYAMWVDPQHRGQGIGGTLVDSVIAWAREGKHQRILLDVGDYNHPAIALYKSKGFQETGVKGALPYPREHISEHQREFVLNTNAG